METLASLHPKVVHFAVALLLTYVLLELLFLIFKRDYLSKSANLILFLGVLGALGSMLTGNQAYHYAESLFDNHGIKIPLGLIDEHEEYATWTLFWFLGILVIRIFLTLKDKFKGWLQIAVFILALVGVFFVYETGEHGGELVYKYGVGTKVIEQGIQKDSILIPSQEEIIKQEEIIEEEHEH